LVGGHCIGVDPYYLQRAEFAIRDYISRKAIELTAWANMAFKVVKLMIKKRNFGKWSYCFDAGITFKENCPDVRNTK
jgi:UDP-N-acetyl-D-galactosamine dehydrogenase